MRVAVAQLDPKLGENERNLETCLARFEAATTAGVELLVLPECALPGYALHLFDDRRLELCGALVEEPVPI